MPPHRPRTILASADAALDHATVARLSDAGFATAEIDAAGTLTTMSPALSTLLGRAFTPAHLDDLPDVYALHDTAGARLGRTQLALDRALSGERVRGQLIGARLPDGSSRWLVVDAAPTSEGGVVDGACLVCSDVTHQVALVERGRRQELAESVNHHLRTPLAVVLGHAELLAELLSGLTEHDGSGAGSGAGSESGADGEGVFHLDRLTRASLQLLVATEEVTRIIRDDLPAEGLGPLAGH